MKQHRTTDCCCNTSNAPPLPLLLLLSWPRSVRSAHVPIVCPSSFALINAAADYIRQARTRCVPCTHFGIDLATSQPSANSNSNSLSQHAPVTRAVAKWKAENGKLQTKCHGASLHYVSFGSAYCRLIAAFPLPSPLREGKKKGVYCSIASVYSSTRITIYTSWH